MWALLVVCLVLSGRAFSLQCPDGSQCGGSSTCCQLPGGSGYACCHQPQFVGTSLRMLPPESVNEISGAVCPDGSTCPLEYSCLLTVDAAFACCPWKEAISCADGHHCCPLGSHCSADGQSCLQSEVLTPATVSAVQCPDRESECPNDSTCCMMPDGSWGCCPMPEASCCSDKIHCCPHDTTCDVEHARCFSATGEEPLGTKFPAKKQAVALSTESLAQNNLCPGNHSTCPDVATCCLLPTGQYGCCPLQNAVCCNDRQHCCPQGTTCDLPHSKCTMTSRWSWPITRLSVDLQTARDVFCDPTHTCPNGNTCCRQASGEWGCCPLEEAVCCSDHIHCCPKGFSCNVAEGTCEEGSRSVPWLLKTDARSAAASSAMVVPCDPQTACPDRQTCCRLASGAWGCCPVPQAVCCPDRIHCCPSGYQCDPSRGSCFKSGSRVPWLEKKPAAVASLNKDVVCDFITSCADGQTCCQIVPDVWACCPFPQAVCCEDHKHCCPNGYTCDVQQSACVKSGASSQLISLAPVRARQVKDVKCDDQTSCKDGQTCCRLASGEWGCCPFPEAVCCTDHVHCCPKDYTCDPSKGICQESSHVLPWAPKQSSLVTQSHDTRCNATASCEEGQTCCKGVSGAWSCCQLPNAVCCEDHQHCCPSGYTCNVAAQTCEKQQGARSLASGDLLIPSRLSTSSQDVSCGDQHYCRDGQTCCEAPSGGWACCPYDKGSCCKDRRHCCPAGFRCSRSGFECYKKWPPRWDMGAFSPRPAPSHPLL